MLLAQQGELFEAGVVRVAPGVDGVDGADRAVVDPLVELPDGGGRVALVAELGDDAVLRTDFVGRDRMRVRASFHTPANLLRFGLVAEDLDQDNMEDGIGFDAEARQYLVAAVLRPGNAAGTAGAVSLLHRLLPLHHRYRR